MLAGAEIEHEDRKDPSCFILFPFEAQVTRGLFPDVAVDVSISLLVWTTTPWTIPLNRGVVLKPSAKYVLLQGKEANQAFVVGAERADAICAMLEIPKKVLAELDASRFEKVRVLHPLIDDFTVPVLLDDMVSTTDGTACLHMAPGCGPEDYLLAVRRGIEIFSPISPDGKYTKGIQPKELEDMPVKDGQFWVLKKLAERGALLHKTSVRHSYPHCWRCQNGLIFRATDQWFCNLEKNDLVKRAIAEIDNISFIPDWGKNRLSATIGNRTEWCISRQRHWGVPIPAILCTGCGQAHLDSTFVRVIADGVAKDGIEYWDSLSIEEIAKLLPEGFTCAGCESTKFTKESDILDVWFDSGISHFAVLEKDETLGVPADLYLEGSDQHRGWFQSSLLTSMVMRNATPTKSIVTHGFIIDEKGLKMSKSRGNTVTPQEIIDTNSIDILRLWVASTDYESDVVISKTLLSNVSEVYRKIRNTCRFLLSNLYDFDPRTDSVEIEKMQAIDKYALARLYEVDQKIREGYKRCHPATVFGALGSYCAVDLSAFYLDILKDRLYVAQADGLARRSGQTVCYLILDTLTRLMAPVLSFMAEELSDAYQEGKDTSIHLQDFPPRIDVWDLLSKAAARLPGAGNIPGRAQYTTVRLTTFGMLKNAQWQVLEQLRDVVLKALEAKRADGLIKHSLEAKVTLYLDSGDESGELIESFMKDLIGPESALSFLKDFFIVSQAEFAAGSGALEKTDLPWAYVMVAHADGVKCPRCWQWEETSHVDNLCQRCAGLIEP